MADADLLPTTSDETAKTFLAAGSLAPAAKPPTDYSSLLPTKEQYQHATSDLTKIQEEKVKAEGGLVSQFEENDKRNRERMERLLKAQGATVDDLKPWNAEKELSDRQVGIWEQFGSPGFLIAMLGSAFSVMPMNAALSAGGAAMNAINQGQMDKYKKAFDAWKANTDLVIQRQQMEHQLYDEVDKLRERDMATWRAKVQAIAARFDDKRKLAMLENGMDAEVLQSLDAEAKSAADLVKAKDAIDESHLRLMYLNSDPRWKSGDPRQMKDAINDWENPANTADTDAYRKFVKETWAKEQRSPTSEEDLAFRKRQAQADYPYRVIPATADVAAVKTDLEAALGHSLSPTMNAALDSAYSAKGATASRVVGSVNRAIHDIEQDLASGKSETEIDPEKRINDAMLAGSMASGRSAAAVYMNKLQLEHPEWGSDKINKAAALYAETQARFRTLGTRGANIDVAVKEAEGAAKLALKRSDEVPRGNWVPITELQQMIQKGTSSPELRRLSVANASLITAYSQTMSRTGTNTVTAQNRAAEVLDMADGPEAYKAGVETLLTEMGIVQDAIRDIESEGTGTAPAKSPATKWERKPDGTLGPAQ